MTYDIFAVFPEGLYKVAETNHPDHGMDVAERVCKHYNVAPHGMIAGPRGNFAYKGNIFTLDQLIEKGKNK